MTRQKSLPEMHETMRIHDIKVRPTIFNTQTNSIIATTNNDKPSCQIQPKDQAMMQPSYIPKTYNLF
jgi:hypothetical protein